MSNGDVGTEQEKQPSAESEAKQTVEQAREALSDFRILEGKGREYIVAGKTIIQKPLVLRDFGRLFEHILEMLSVLVTVRPEMLKGGAIEIDTSSIGPEFILSLAHGSADMMDKVYDIVAMVTKTNRDFLLDNLSIKQFTDIISDALELNDLKEIIANFSRMGSQIRQYLQAKMTKVQT